MHSDRDVRREASREIDTEKDRPVDRTSIHYHRRGVHVELQSDGGPSQAAHCCQSEAGG